MDPLLNTIKLLSTNMVDSLEKTKRNWKFCLENYLIEDAPNIVEHILQGTLSAKEKAEIKKVLAAGYEFFGWFKISEQPFQVRNNANEIRDEMKDFIGGQECKDQNNLNKAILNVQDLFMDPKPSDTEYQYAYYKIGKYYVYDIDAWRVLNKVGMEYNKITGRLLDLNWKH